MTRAAVFAGVAACASTPQHKAPPPPPPVEYPFALPPAPADGRASLSGVVRQNGYRKAGVSVTVRSDGVEQETRTNDKGEFQFLDLAPGRYEVVADPGYQNHRPQDGPVVQPSIAVELLPNANERRDLTVVPPPAYVPDTGPCCKPYGAPPARRRIV